MHSSFKHKAQFDWVELVKSLDVLSNYLLLQIDWIKRNFVAANEIPDRHPEEQMKQQSEAEEVFEVEIPQATELGNNVMEYLQY